LDSAAAVEKIPALARELGMKHVALTDHGNMFGILEFYDACVKNGVNPILGCEFYVAPGSRHIKSGGTDERNYYHLVLLAKNQTGYSNMMKLCSLGYTEGFYYRPRIDEELLGLYHEGLICTSACIAGEIPLLILDNKEKEALDKAGFYAELFGKGNYYLEIQDHGIPEEKRAARGLVSIAKRLGLPLIATNDTHYLKKEHANAHDTLLRIGTRKKKTDSLRTGFDSPEFYMKSPDEMTALFAEIPEALANTLEIAEKCRVTLNRDSQPLLPDYAIPPEFSSPEDYLRRLATEGFHWRYPAADGELEKRLEYELDIITRMKFTGYFLIVWDFIHYAKEHGIPVGPGRGSGAGSIVAYSLKITDIDPIKYNLLFERFLNPERTSMPDFDIDFCYERRQEVIDYVTEKYGKDRVGQIITFGTLQPRAVIKDVARVLDISFDEANAIADMVSYRSDTLSSALTTEPKLAKLKKRGGVYPELIETSLVLEGLARHACTHAAGLVIGKSDLTDYVPLYRDARTGAISTQYPMNQLESCSLVKMDFLGLKTLTLIKNAQDIIRKENPGFDIDRIPEDDAKTFALLCEGKSAGVFQFEGQGMQGVLKRAKPASIEDLIALNALYRPGPMDNIDQFINSKNGKTKITYPDASLEPVLKKTYGVIVYQEQVMQIAQVVAGFTLGHADLLRRAMGKRDMEKMVKEKVSFIEGAVAKGYTEEKAAEIFELLIPFAGYGFNKSHAAAYSVLAYKTAYLKAHFPAEFMAANLTAISGYYHSDRKEYIAETREMGIKILSPDINLSEKYFTVVDGNILYGFLSIKHLGEATVEKILETRREKGPFTSFSNFLERINIQTVNKRVLESVIKRGLFDRLHPNRAEILASIDTALCQVKKG
jgi:DNA polymerase-3 subunit alpha